VTERIVAKGGISRVARSMVMPAMPQEMKSPMPVIS